MAFGDIIMRQHLGYQHFAFEGQWGRAIEYTKRYGGGTPRVMLTTIDEVARGGGTTYRRPYPPDAVFTPVQAWQRLYSRLGEQRYSVTANNCESLLNWAIYGRSHSKQGNELAEIGKVAAGFAVLALVVAALDG